MSHRYFKSGIKLNSLFTSFPKPAMLPTFPISLIKRTTIHLENWESS